MSDAKNPPNELYEDPEKLIEYYENAKKAKEAKENKKGFGKGKQSEYMGSTVFGASKEELEALAGSEGDEGDAVMVNFSKEASKTKGDMGLNELLNLHKK